MAQQPHAAQPNVVYVTDVEHQERVCKQLLQTKLVIVDTEGPKANLIQLLAPASCLSSSTVYLLHNLPITTSLHQLLGKPTIVKAGFALVQDKQHFRNRCGLELDSVVDLQVFLIPCMGVTSLSAAVERFTGQQKAFETGYAGTVEWCDPLLPGSKQWQYAVSDPVLIYALYQQFLPQLQQALPPALPAMGSPGTGLGDLPQRIAACRSEDKARNLVQSSNIIREITPLQRQEAIDSLVRKYWAPLPPQPQHPSPPSAAQPRISMPPIENLGPVPRGSGNTTTTTTTSASSSTSVQRIAQNALEFLAGMADASERMRVEKSLEAAAEAQLQFGDWSTLADHVAADAGRHTSTSPRREQLQEWLPHNNQHVQYLLRAPSQRSLTYEAWALTHTLASAFDWLFKKCE